MAEQHAKSSAPDAEAAPAQPAGPACGSKEHYDGSESSLKGKASDMDIKARAAAARGQAKHLSPAVQRPRSAPKARKTAAGAWVGRGKAQDGPTR